MIRDFLISCKLLSYNEDGKAENMKMAAWSPDRSLPATPAFVCQLPVKPSRPKLDFIRERMKERRFSWDPRPSGIHSLQLPVLLRPCCVWNTEETRRAAGLLPQTCDLHRRHLTLSSGFFLCVHFCFLLLRNCFGSASRPQSGLMVED